MAAGRHNKNPDGVHAVRPSKTAAKRNGAVDDALRVGHRTTTQKLLRQILSGRSLMVVLVCIGEALMTVTYFWHSHLDTAEILSSSLGSDCLSEHHVCAWRQP